MSDFQKKYLGSIDNVKKKKKATTLYQKKKKKIIEPDSDMKHVEMIRKGI